MFNFIYGMTEKDKLLFEIYSVGAPIKVHDLLENTGVNRASSGVFLRQLRLDGLIEKIGYGVYIMTAKGKDRVEYLKSRDFKTLSTNVTTGSSRMAYSRSENEEDELKNAVLAYKARYGKEKLLSKLIEYKELIE